MEECDDDNEEGYDDTDEEEGCDDDDEDND